MCGEKAVLLVSQHDLNFDDVIELKSDLTTHRR